MAKQIIPVNLSGMISLPGVWAECACVILLGLRPAERGAGDCLDVASPRRLYPVHLLPVLAQRAAAVQLHGTHLAAAA